MEHNFDLAFNLLDEAAERIGHQQYGITVIDSHNHGPIRLTTEHHYTRGHGHRLVLLAADDYGLLAAIEATATDLDDEPQCRIVKVRADDTTFHAVPGASPYTFRATDRGHTYTIAAHIGDAPSWTLRVDNLRPMGYDDLDEALADALDFSAAA